MFPFKEISVAGSALAAGRWDQLLQACSSTRIFPCTRRHHEVRDANLALRDRRVGCGAFCVNPTHHPSSFRALLAPHGDGHRRHGDHRVCNGRMAHIYLSRCHSFLAMEKSEKEFKRHSKVAIPRTNLDHFTRFTGDFNFRMHWALFCNVDRSCRFRFMMVMPVSSDDKRQGECQANSDLHFNWKNESELTPLVT